MPATTPTRISKAILAALNAARADGKTRDENVDADFAEAVADLNSLDQSQLTIVLAGIIQRLLEILHPDGLDGDDVHDALADTVQAHGWYGTLQPEAIGEVLLGALGVLAPEDAKTSGVFPAHAILVIDTLAARQPVPVADLIATELAEIRRAETVEMP